MRHVTDKEEIEEIKKYMGLAADEAQKSKCKKSQRGAIIVLEGNIVGRGHNKPTIENLYCLREQISNNSRVELCSAIHAEQMAIVDAANGGTPLAGARLYHIKTKRGQMRQSGNPSCTVCSRLVVTAGIEVVLWHNEGYAIYGPEEFNEISYKYFLE